MGLSTDKLYTPADEPPSDKPLLELGGDTSIDALKQVVNRTAEPFQGEPDPKQGDVGKVSHYLNALLGAVGMPFELLNTGLSLLTSPLNALVPGMPAATLGVPHLGMPHSHPHPPSSGAPLPAFGPTICAGAINVLIDGVPAARAGDLGYAPTCGSLAPIFEIFTGSSNTFIGGARAARMGIDITRQCVPGLPFKKLRKVGEQAEAAAKAAKEASKARKAFDKAKGVAGMALEGAGVAAGGLSAAAEQAGGDSDKARLTAAQAGADAAAMALGALMGKDPGAPPCIGALILGNPTVLIGGFPLPDALALLAKAKGGMPKLPKRNSYRGKHRAAPGRYRGKHERQNSRGDRPGHPIDPVTGASANEFLDYADHGFLAFRWERYYNSAWCNRNSPLGFGFRHCFQRELILLRTRAIYVDAELREYEFSRDQEGRYGGIFAGFELAQIDDLHFELRHEIQGNMAFARKSASGKSARLIGLVLEKDRSDFHYTKDGRLERIVQVSNDGQALRSETRFRYDSHGHIVEMVRSAADGAPLSIAAYAYDEAGCLTEWRDPLGAIGSHAFDANRRMTRETDQNGFSFFYQYDGEGRCIASAGQDKLWRVKLRYEPGRTRVTEADGGEWIFHYNRAGTLTRIEDPYGGARDRISDASGRIVEEIDSGGRVTQWLYDEQGRNTGRRDRWGNLWPTQDEAPNLPNPLAHEVPSTPLGLQWGEPESESDAKHLAMPHALSHLAAEVLVSPAPILPEPRLIRDAAGRVEEEIDVYGRSETFGHDAAGNMIRRQDKDGREYHYTTVSWNLRGTESDPLGNMVEYGYTLREKVAFIADANGNESHYSYDYKDRITSVTRHGVLRERYQYDVGDRLIEKHDADGNLLLKFEVGKNGLHSKRILTSGEVHHYEYDRRGNFTKASTEKHDVRMTHNRAGRRTSDKCNGSGISHSYKGMWLAKTDYFDRFTVAYETQDNGEVLIATPVGGTHRLRRTADGRISIRLGNGSHLLLAYDGDGRCIGRIHWQGERTEDARWTRYEYSPEGELRRVSDSRKETVEFRYDAAHRLVAEIHGPEELLLPPVEQPPPLAVDPDATVQISRELVSRALDPDPTVRIKREKVTRALDPDATLRIPRELVARALAPDSTVRIKREKLATALDQEATVRISKEDMARALEWDATREIPRAVISSWLEEEKRSSRPLDAHEANDHRISSHWRGEGWNRGGDSTTRLGDLPTLLPLDAHGGWTVRRYEYDPAGNLLSNPHYSWLGYREGNRLSESPWESFHYNHRNHLSEVIGAGQASTRYCYDSMDMLIKVEWSDREETWTAEYDGLCRRIATTHGDKRTEYWWDDDRPAAELAPDGRLRLYVYANEAAFLPFMFIDYAGVDAEPEAGQAYFVFHNQVGLPEWIEDDRGKTVWRAEDIDPYGAITVAAGNTVAYDLRFPGHYFDPETGLHYNRFRYYSPTLGRYLQSDPKGQSGGINLYAYPANPLVWVDVLGLTHKQPLSTPPDGPEDPSHSNRAKWGRVEHVIMRKAHEEELKHYDRQTRRLSGSLPRNMDVVRNVAETYGITIPDIRIIIDRGGTMNPTAETSPNIVITLYMGAFQSEQRLACNLEHELFHARELQDGFLHPKVSGKGSEAFEDRAYEHEIRWWWRHGRRETTYADLYDMGQRLPRTTPKQRTQRTNCLEAWEIPASHKIDVDHTADES